MQNKGIAFGGVFKTACKADTIILHSAFCILHFPQFIKY